MNKESKPNIGFVIIAGHLDEESAVFAAVQNFIDIFDHVSESITILGPEQTSIEDRVNVNLMERHPRPTVIHTIIFHIYLQTRITHSLVKNRNEFDVVFFHLGGTVLLMPLLISRVLDLKPIIIVTGSVKASYAEQHQDNIVTKAMQTIIEMLETVSTRLASKVIFLSESMKLQFQSLDDDRTTVANLNYIDTTEFDKQISKNERKYDLIFVGRFEKVKGIKKFVRSVSILAQLRQEIQVALVGDGQLRPEVQRIIAENDLEDNIELFGWVDRKKVPRLLGNSRYLILPSESEGVPKTLLEAMSCGTVPFATRVGGVPDIISDGETGFLLSSNEPNEMANEINMNMENVEWNRLSSQARQYVISTHSFEKCKRDYITVIQDIIE